MGLRVSFVRYTPPPNFDGIPWSDAQIEEAATETGTYTLIDTLSLGTPDLDPTNPVPRNFSTINGTAPDQWYRVIFVDAFSTTSEPTEPIQNTTLAVSGDPYTTVDELARILKIRTPSAAQTAALERVLRTAAGEINSEIDRTDSLSGWELDLAAQVNLDRAADLWRHTESAPGILGIPDEAITAAQPMRYSWARYAARLSPLKQQFGLA